MVKDEYEPLNKQLDIIYDKYPDKSLKSKEQLKIIMRQRGLHHIKGRNFNPSDLQLSYAWSYLENTYAPVKYVPSEFESVESISNRKIKVVRDKKSGRFVKWLS